MKKSMIITIITLLSLIGCSTLQDDPTKAPGFSVTPEQAKDLAQDKYNLTEHIHLELIQLTITELENLSPEIKYLTPYYYVISGQLDKNDVLVYVSSNNIEHHFLINDE